MLKAFIGQIFNKEAVKLKSITYIFCSDDYLLKLNKGFLKHNYYTDILTFDLSNQKNVVEGEIYISIDRVMENAENMKISFKKELHRVIFHGALHLCGYKDKTKKEILEMRAQEDKYLQLYF
jgi:probable rRNA maturation factor